MMETTRANPAPGLDAELRGRSAGMGILAFFAFAWIGWGLSSVPIDVTIPVLAVSAAASVLLAVSAVTLRRRASTAAPAVDHPDRRRVGRRFGLIVSIEWIGLGLVAWALGGTGHSELIPAVVCAGVGLHFLPLATLFNVRPYYVTGVAMCVVAAATVVLAPTTGVSALWELLPGFGAALTLYATAIAIWRGAPRSRVG